VKLGIVVEGHGEVTAVPIVVRRLMTDAGVPRVEMPPPLRLSKGKMLKQQELARAVELMARKTAPQGPLLVVLDADADCPAELGPRLFNWAQAARSDRPIGVVVAKREFESWFIAAARSLRGCRGLPNDLEPPPDAEAVRNPKQWLNDRMPHGYSETLDQPALASTFDLNEARRLPSFDKFTRDLFRLAGVRSGSESGG
jgi:hypothetical protein